VTLLLPVSTRLKFVELGVEVRPAAAIPGDCLLANSPVLKNENVIRQAHCCEALGAVPL